MDPLPVLPQLAAALHDIVAFTRLDIVLLDDDRQTCRVRTLLETRPEAAAANLRTSRELGFTGRLLSLNSPLEIWRGAGARLAPEDVADEWLENGSLRAVLSLRLGGASEAGGPGVLHIGALDEQAFAPPGIEAAHQFALHLGLALEREWARRKLGREADELTDFFENAAIPLNWVGPDGTLLRANRAELELLGYRETDYLAHNFAEFYEDPRTAAELLDRLARGETLRDFDARLRCSDGSFREVLIDANVLWDGASFLYARCCTRDVTERKRGERRAAVHHEVSHHLADWPLGGEATKGILRGIGERLGWQLGVMWRVNAQAGVLRCEEVWQMEGAQSDEFAEMTRASEFRPGDGLPGGVWAALTPAWVPNVTRNASCLRARFAERVGLHGALAFPVRAGAAILGVMEFFSAHIERPDPELLALAGSIGHEVGLFLDRMRAEISLEASERRFTRFMSNLPATAWVKDRDGHYIYVNDLAERVFGRPRRELHGCTDYDLFPPEAAVAFRENDRRALASEGGLLTTETLQLPDGSLRYSLVSKFPILDSDGRATMVGGVAFDITEQIQTAEALRHVEQRFRTMAETAPSCVWEASPGGDITFANSRWYEFSGLTAEETAGQNWVVAIHPDDLETCRTAWVKAVREETPFRVEVRNRRADGQYRWMLTQALPVRDAQGSITSWVGTSTDIDDQKRQEAALREADRRKDEFLAVLSHELRNPLEPIRNALHLLRAHPVPDENLRLLEMLERQVQHMIRLVDDLLDVSRITLGKVELRRDRVDLAYIVAHAVEACRPLIDAGGRRLTLSLPPEPLLLDADPVRLGQALANLLNNAARFTLPGGHIALSALRAGDNVIVRVRDNGVGIEPEMLTRVFELFAQGGWGVAQPGLGIGLTVVDRMVRLHGGSVEAHSAGRDRGSEFILRLPLAAAPRPAVEQPPAAPADGSWSRHRILVVDDNHDAADSLSLLLQFKGGTVHTEYSGVSALEAVRAFRPDIALVDIGMPGMDGLEVARRLREDAMLQNLTLVAVTGWGQDDDRRRCRDAGFDYHLVKPVDLARLQALLAELPVNPLPTRSPHAEDRGNDA